MAPEGGAENDEPRPSRNSIWAAASRTARVAVSDVSRLLWLATAVATAVASAVANGNRGSVNSNKYAAAPSPSSDTANHRASAGSTSPSTSAPALDSAASSRRDSASSFVGGDRVAGVAKTRATATGAVVFS